MPQTAYRLTAEGRPRLERYLAHLEAVIAHAPGPLIFFGGALYDAKYSHALRRLDVCVAAPRAARRSSPSSAQARARPASILGGGGHRGGAPAPAREGCPRSAALAVAVVYGVLLLGAALLSRDRTLAPGETKVLLRDGLPHRLHVDVGRRRAGRRATGRSPCAPGSTRARSPRSGATLPCRPTRAWSTWPTAPATGTSPWRHPATGPLSRALAPGESYDTTVRFTVPPDGLAAAPLRRRRLRAREPADRPREQPLPREDLFRASGSCNVMARDDGARPMNAARRALPRDALARTPSARTATGSAPRKSSASAATSRLARALADDLWELLPGLRFGAAEERARFFHNAAVFYGSPGPGRGSSRARSAFGVALEHFAGRPDDGWHARALHNFATALSNLGTTGGTAAGVRRPLRAGPRCGAPPSVRSRAASRCTTWASPCAASPSSTRKRAARTWLRAPRPCARPSRSAPRHGLAEGRAVSERT